jgi:hypothetical protein
MAPFGSWRVAGFLALFGLAAAFIAYLTITVPVSIPVLPRDQAARYWPAAAAATAFVVALDILVIAYAVHRARRPGELASDASKAETLSIGFAIPRELRLQRVPGGVANICLVASCGLLIGTVLEGFPLWFCVLAMLLPWLPVFASEAIWKYEHYGFYAFFLVVTVLQLGPLGEHATQVTQLVMSHGDLDRSHGVFGQLDFETVHFVWDSTIWLGTGALVYKFSGNRWLWLSFAFASLHEVEHVYLYCLFTFHEDFYMQGGLAGIMGHGGVIGSPLARPYLHFMYNFLVIVPMVIGFWDQTKQAYDRFVARALPGLTGSELRAMTQHALRTKVPAGEAIVRQGQPADRFYIIADGEVQVVREGGPATLLGPGQGFGEIGPLASGTHFATVRATRPVELLIVERAAFVEFLTKSYDRRSALLEAQYR